MSKPIEYWEVKRDEVLAYIRSLQEVTLLHRSVGPVPHRRHRDSAGNIRYTLTLRAWRDQYNNWLFRLRAEKRKKKALAKAYARLAYINQRIEVLSPTFWEKL